MSSNRVLISCTVLTLVACFCLSLASILGAGAIVFTRQVSEDSVPEVTTVVRSVEEQMNEIETQMVELRGLELREPIARNLWSSEQLRQHVMDDLLQDYTLEEARQDVLALWSFGLLDRDYDLSNLYIELYSEQIAGFYDQESKEMYVIQGEGFTGPERLTYAHEVVHALQDQTYGIQENLRFSDTACEQDSERCAAVSALLEGDASLAQTIWFSNHSTLQDQKEITAFYASYESPMLDNAPEFLQQDFFFPYQEGQAFVESIYNKGGWEAIDQVYLNPPQSTEQILHPDRYPDDVPQAVVLPELEQILGAGWEEIDRGVMGEWYTYLILAMGRDSSSRIPETRAQRAAEGWEGDAYVVYHHAKNDQIVMALYTLWDQDDQVMEFAETFRVYANNRFGEPLKDQNANTLWQESDAYHYFLQDQAAARTLWIFAPGAELAESIRDFILDR